MTVMNVTTELVSGKEPRNTTSNKINNYISVSASEFCKTDNQLIESIKYTQWVELGIRKYKGKTPYSEEETSS